MMIDISAITKLDDVFRIIQDSDISNFIDSITVDVKSQKIIFQMQRLLKSESDSVDEYHSVPEDPAEARIARLSESCRTKLPELLNHFRDWKPCREKLIKTLKSSSSNIERNSALVSGFRIVTSAADIFGTFLRRGGKPAHSWADFAMEYASTFGVVARFLEMTLSKTMYNNVKKAIKEDQEIFKKIIQWFLQFEELDAAIKSAFPYVIDTSIVTEINNCSSHFDEHNKFFMAIFASNVKQNVELFKNKEFLLKADHVASSEAGKLWFHKIILENDHYLQHCLNSTLCDEIQSILKLSPTEDREMYVEACRALPSIVRMKMILNALTIISEANNLLCGTKSDISEKLGNISESAEKQLAEIKRVVLLIKPSGLDVDPILE